MYGDGNLLPSSKMPSTQVKPNRAPGTARGDNQTQEETTGYKPWGCTGLHTLIPNTTDKAEPKVEPPHAWAKLQARTCHADWSGQESSSPGPCGKGQGFGFVRGVCAYHRTELPSTHHSQPKQLNLRLYIAEWCGFVISPIPADRPVTLA